MQHSRFSLWSWPPLSQSCYGTIFPFLSISSSLHCFRPLPHIQITAQLHHVIWLDVSSAKLVHKKISVIMILWRVMITDFPLFMAISPWWCHFSKWWCHSSQSWCQTIPWWCQAPPHITKWQTDRRSKALVDWHTDTQIMQTDRHTDGQNDQQTDIQTPKMTIRQTYRHSKQPK